MTLTEWRKTKAKREKSIFRVQRVWRNIEFRNDCSKIQRLIHRISILPCSHQNENRTMCKDELRNCRWKEILDQSEDEWRLKWNRIEWFQWNSIDEDRRSTNDDQRFDCCRRNVCQGSCSSRNRGETNHRSATRNCSTPVKHRIGKSSSRTDSPTADELLNEEQMMMFQWNRSNEDWKDVDGENHSSFQSHSAESSEKDRKKDPEELWFPPIDQQLFEEEFRFLLYQRMTTKSFETNSSKNDRKKVKVPTRTKRRHEDREEREQWRRTRSDAVEVSFSEMFSIEGRWRRALPTLGISFFARDSLERLSKETKTAGVFTWKCCPTFKWMFNDLVRRRITSFISLFNFFANCFCSKRFRLSEDSFSSWIFSKSVS